MKTKVKVSERALVARLNRRLSQRNELLKKCRDDSRWINEMGAYYVVDLRHNSVLRKHVNLDAFAREEGLLKTYEELAS